MLNFYENYVKLKKKETNREKSKIKFTLLKSERQEMYLGMYI